jgi:hypothetical protein
MSFAIFFIFIEELKVISLNLILKAFVLPLFMAVVLLGPVNAQDVPAVYGIDVQEYYDTGEFFISTVVNEIGENESKDSISVYFQVRKVKNTTYKFRYFLCISSSMDLGCSGLSDNHVKIKFEDGESIKLDKDISDINCKVPVESKYEIGDEMKEKLKTNKVESIRLKQSKYYSDFKVFYPEFFIKTFQLLDRHR